MGRAILGAFLAAIAMFGWGWLVWSPVLDLHEIRAFEKSDAISAAMKDSGDETGVYWIPAMPEEMDTESESYKAWLAKYEAGPRAMVIFRNESGPFEQVMSMAKGFALQFVACLLLAFLLLGGSVTSFFGRWIFSITVGLIMVAWADGMNWAFWQFPDEWTMWQAIDHAAAFGIAGFVLALIVRPKAE